MDALRIEFATEIFLADMRRAAVALNPDKPAPIGSLSSYPPDQRSALMRAVKNAILSSGEGQEKNFKAWKQKRMDRLNDAPEDQ